MSVDFADKRVKVFTPNATNGQLLVNGAAPIVNELVRVHWLPGAAGPLYVEKDVSVDNTARTTEAYSVTVDQKDHVIVGDGCPIRVSGNAADANLVALERLKP